MSFEYKFNFFLRVTLQIYLETSILGMLNIANPMFDNLPQVWSFLTSIVLIDVLLFFLFWGTRFSLKNFKHFRDKERVDIPEYESMFGEYKTKNIPQALFNSFFMLRRLLYACIIIFLEKYPMMQAFTFTWICLPILAYQIVMNPYLDKIINIVMNINEISFVVIGIFFFNFGEPNNNADELNILGWTVISIIKIKKNKNKITIKKYILIWFEIIIEFKTPFNFL